MAQPQLSADHLLLMLVAAEVVDIQPHLATQAAAVVLVGVVVVVMVVLEQVFQREPQTQVVEEEGQEMDLPLHKMVLLVAQESLL